MKKREILDHLYALNAMLDYVLLARIRGIYLPEDILSHFIFRQSEILEKVFLGNYNKDPHAAEDLSQEDLCVKLQEAKIPDVLETVS